jgi:7-cyano-7-deazaguanine synthase
MMKVVVYSGGMDSFTLLHSVLEQERPRGGHKVIALSFNYGQRHAKELNFASQVCGGLMLDHRIIQVPMLGAVGGSALTDDAMQVPEGHYEAASMKQTVVPGRNTIMLSMAMGLAEAIARQRDEQAIVFYGAHSGDHHIYPDCRPEYIEAMQLVYTRATEGVVRLAVPFQNFSKGGILKLGLQMGLNYGNSWTCYNGLKRPCGKCGACVERAEAFAENNADDPLLRD